MWDREGIAQTLFGLVKCIVIKLPGSREKGADDGLSTKVYVSISNSASVALIVNTTSPLEVVIASV